MASAPTKPKLVKAVEPAPPVEVTPKGLVTLVAVMVRGFALTVLPVAAVLMLTVVPPVVVSVIDCEL